MTLSCGASFPPDRDRETPGRARSRADQLRAAEFRQHLIDRGGISFFRADGARRNALRIAAPIDRQRRGILGVDQRGDFGESLVISCDHGFGFAGDLEEAFQRILVSYGEALHRTHSRRRKWAPWRRADARRRSCRSLARSRGLPTWRNRSKTPVRRRFRLAPAFPQQGRSAEDDGRLGLEINSFSKRPGLQHQPALIQRTARDAQFLPDKIGGRIELRAGLGHDRAKGRGLRIEDELVAKAALPRRP